MKFEIDNQTLKDLEIFDTVKNRKSVFEMFNSTYTIGGKDKLYNYLKNPLSDYEKIKERRNAIAFFQSFKLAGELEIDKNSLDFIEHYLNLGNYPTKPPTRFFAVEKGIFNKLAPSNDYYIVERGVQYTIELINIVYRFSILLDQNHCPALLKKYNEDVLTLPSLEGFSDILQIEKLKKNSFYTMAKYDYMFRYIHKERIRFLLNLIYKYDVFMAVAKTAARYSFSYPEVVSDQIGISITGLFHPFISNPVKNNIEFVSQRNHLFVSGPNMAGKSTFLKALGIAVYLAHVGFPVPAEKMTINVLSGLYTTINLSDNINSGYSHFYSEVARIKEVSGKLNENKMMVIFDELFRGTNVKDAYDGTLAVISAFTNVRNSYFAISSHIVEAAYKLEHLPNIRFGYMEIIKKEEQPHYTYKLKEGISDERLGMHIIRQEKVIEIINKINN
ncbi:DNA mismatch repair ATPase MutS [Dysgonomonas hofstadii]|uniref:DNA mismatch repair ATPase MutS n=1 Tax=Dysgonomonas hofstadii TaxID=637886 RepID=A0A840CK24_9BACT|nr:hypothetical protein [Dysgonomonas hofstadii]MBB4035521.1 DNA mismatch repair ATPase MutS [Dysgonomonas hofstadii]